MGDDLQLLRRDQDSIAWLTLNRPAARNALSAALMSALESALDAVDYDPSIRVVVIGGAGPAFCSGHDLGELRAMDAHTLEVLFAQCSRLMQRIVSFRAPVIACVRGIAAAAGCQLVASCDLAIAGDAASFSTPGVRIGLFCSTPMVALSRSIGRKAAMEMLLTGDVLDASRAQALGLVNRVVADDALDDAVRMMAGRIARGSPAAVRIGKPAFYQQAELPLADAYAHAASVMVRNMGEDDAAEGIDAFLGKRDPVWAGPGSRSPIRG